MSDYIEINDKEIRFLADSHFRSREVPGESERRDRFIRFLASVPDGTTLILLGDVFDFYFEYRSVVCKRFVDLFAAFSNCRNRGINLHFLGGNHDYWVGDFISKDLGMSVHQDEILLSAQGRKIICSHGDLVMPRDAGYKVLKTIIRNRFVIGVSKWIHPDIMDAIARAVASGSRRLSKAPQKRRARNIAEVAHARFFARGNDAYIMGHVHYPLHDSRNGRDFILLGDWIQNFTYGRLRDGVLTLETFRDGASD